MGRGNSLRTKTSDTEPDQPGYAGRMFQPLAQGGISVDTIVQNASVKPVAAEIGAPEVLADTHLAKVSVVGAGMQSGPGHADYRAGREYRRRSASCPTTSASTSSSQTSALTRSTAPTCSSWRATSVTAARSSSPGFRR